MTDDELDLIPVETLLDTIARRYEHVVFMGVGEDGKFRSHINTTDYITALGVVQILAEKVRDNLQEIQDAEGV